MKSPFEIIIKPHVTEKSMRLSEGNVYIFIVQKNANKIDIKRSIEKIFPKVKVKSVRTITRLGKPARYRFGHGYRPDTKKAIVTLKEGRIDII